jgi:hypothetical protein
VIGLDVRGLVSFLQSLGPFGMLAFLLVGFYLRWWVFGWQYQELKEDRDEWKLLAQTGTVTAERATTAATEVTTRARRATR